MKQLSEPDKQRLDLLYTVLDENYRALRRYARLHLSGVVTGNLIAARVSDAHLATITHNTFQVWVEITSILNPAPEPAVAPDAKAEGEKDAGADRPIDANKKEFLQ
jgi:hypothetical protein